MFPAMLLGSQIAARGQAPLEFGGWSVILVYTLSPCSLCGRTAPMAYHIDVPSSVFLIKRGLDFPEDFLTSSYFSSFFILSLFPVKY